MTRAQVFRWAVPFMWRAITRTLNLFWNTMVVLPWLTLVHHLRAPTRDAAAPPHDQLPRRRRPARRQHDRVRRGLAVPRAPRRRAHADPPAAQPAAAHPVVQGHRPGRARRPRRVDRRRRLVEGTARARVGDAARRARRARPREAARRRHGDVHLFAHSQGAAVATFALFEELEPRTFNVRRLTTVGAAVVLLGREKWQGRKDEYTPVKTWIERNRDAAPEDRVAWENHWAIWDPFSAGPIADTPAAARKRWRAAYFPSGETARPRPRGARRAQHEPALARPRRLLREHACRWSSRPCGTCSVPTSRPSRPPSTTSATASS